MGLAASIRRLPVEVNCRACYSLPVVQGLEFYLSLAVALVVAYLLAFWVALLIWTFRDIRSRSRNPLTALFAVLLVAVFNIPGLVLYPAAAATGNDCRAVRADARRRKPPPGAGRAGRVPEVQGPGRR
ncbi:MAG: hypothetical protein KatS3mg061_3312 [Dehalococcoidia bacterium]|nr:MAG: hypothetical protein KatS3mg061_3312 [Dehalococcoidia bacterium]